MFRATLFIIAKTWKQPKCPSTCLSTMDKMWYDTHTHIYTYTVELIHKKNEIAICNKMDGARDYHTE